VQDAGVLEAHAVLGSRRSSTSPDRRSTGPVVLAGLEGMPTRSWIPSVEGIRVELTSVEQIQCKAWMVNQEWRGERTSVCRAPGMAPARRRGAGHSGDVCMDVVRGVDGA
jgi:hypothetical protein